MRRSDRSSRAPPEAANTHACVTGTLSGCVFQSNCATRGGGFYGYNVRSRRRAAVNCGGISVEERSWGAIKAKFTE